MSRSRDAWGKLYAGLTITAVLCVYTFPLTAAASIKKVVILTTTGENTYAVPGDWNNYDNLVEVIGGGGGGGRSGSAGAGGGGGGAYARVSNIDLTGVTSVTYQGGTGGPGGAANSSNGTGGGDTFFHRTTGSNTTCTAGDGRSGSSGNISPAASRTSRRRFRS